MILLLSSDGDYSTNLIIKWLKHYKCFDFIRLNPMDFVDNKILIYPSDGVFIYNDKPFNFSSIKVVWYRRFGGYSSTSHYFKVKKEIDQSVSDLLKFEINNILDYFVSLLPKNAEIIGSTSRSNTNKLIELYNAKLVGLNVPTTFITSRKKDVEQCLRSGQKLISKSAYNALGIGYNHQHYTMFTSEIIQSDINMLPDVFFPSLVQEKLEKDYEVRIFYFLGQFFCMAIISQDNPQTKIDFRKYDIKKPNRFVPCEIDSVTKTKIKEFMNNMNLNIGSLDFVKTISGELFFLEVNYMGQFGMVDFPCNYGIHKFIAETLINRDLYERF